MATSDDPKGDGTLWGFRWDPENPPPSTGVLSRFTPEELAQAARDVVERTREEAQRRARPYRARSRPRYPRFLD